MPFANAVHDGLIRVNPASPRSVGRVFEEERMERGIFSPEDLAALVGAAEGDWKGAILMGAFTGARLTDVTNLTWGSLDLDGQIPTVAWIPQKTKNRGSRAKKVVVPLQPDLVSWLRGREKQTGGHPLFPTLANRLSGGRGTKGGLSAEFKDVMEQAGITSGFAHADATGKGRKLSYRSFHSLRHTFNSALANTGTSQEIRQKLTGHASAAMNDRYTHTDLEVLQAAIERMPRLAP